MLETWRIRYDRFRQWQEAPYRVKGMTDEEHDCPTCGRHYVGNYCPQCGQSSTIGRYSFKKALLLYLDVWGLGNRGMFRSLRDLLLRPGYMIRDYLEGMQMAYFPPFKMLFLLLALSLLVNSGENIRGENRIKDTQETYERDYKKSLELSRHATHDPSAATAQSGGLTQAKKHSLYLAIDKGLMEFNEWTDRHQALFTLLLLLMLSVPLYLAFRHCPNIPDMRYSEFFVALVYITNMLTMITIVLDFFCVRFYGLRLALSLLMVVPLSQLSGYSFVATLLRTVGVFVLIAVLLLAAFVGTVYVYAKTL